MALDDLGGAGVAGGDGVSTGAAKELVDAVVSVECVGSPLPVDRVIPGSARDDVVTTTTEDRVVTDTARDGVGAAETADRVIACGS